MRKNKILLIIYKIKQPSIMIPKFLLKSLPYVSKRPSFILPPLIKRNLKIPGPPIDEFAFIEKQMQIDVKELNKCLSKRKLH